MNLRLANLNDLLKLKVMYKEIIDNMNKNNIEIWDDIYPCEFLKDDIESNALYLLVEDNEDIVGAFALCESNSGENYVKWENKDEKALYIERFGVNIHYLRKGIGSLLIKYAIDLTKEKGCNYLRLFVVDINKPAINLYLKNGFNKVDGIYEERFDDFELIQYGFEIKI